MAMTLEAGVSPFAHLMAPRAAAPKAEEKEKTQKKAAVDDDSENSDEVEDIEDEKKDDAEDKVADPDAPEDDDESEDDEVKKIPADAKGKKTATSGARSAAVNSAYTSGMSAGRKAERARCSAIFTSPHAGKNPAAAATLAFTTSMSASSAIGVLAATTLTQAPAEQQQARGGLRDRVAKNPNVGSEGAGAEGAPSLAAQIVAAGRKRRGEI